MRRRSSEILLHLAIMKAVPAARAVVHCHPPHATALRAGAAWCRPSRCWPSTRCSSGPSRWCRTRRPARRPAPTPSCPLAARHNTILMANHGVVTWADTLIHAEWFVEVMDTTCRVLILAGPARRPAAGDSARHRRRPARRSSGRWACPTRASATTSPRPPWARGRRPWCAR
ncbi:MAG: class II aldolase/adducin family protein [Comamonadaceae bacterium]|nr:class II aldolase/adducin family protein [Comamonadaceae bacterium]